jgi:hypothetical protein
MPELANDHLFKLGASSFVSRIRHELAHLVYTEDILLLLKLERISTAKAIESIEMRIAGNEPALPSLSEMEQES